MLFDFYPWQLDVDIASTKQLYKATDFAQDKTANAEFMEQLSSTQQHFFASLGVEPYNT